MVQNVEKALFLVIFEWCLSDAFQSPLFLLPVIQAVLDLIHRVGLFGPEQVRLLQHDVHLGGALIILLVACKSRTKTRPSLT